METLNLLQGSPEWHAARAAHFCASDAPAMLGLSKYKTRNDLIREKATGITPDVDAGTQMLFDRGHAVEAKARPIAEALAGDSLYPVTHTAVIEGLALLASLDGATMFGDVNWENKLFNKELADYITSSNDLPDTHWPQVEHQHLVSGADKTLFTVSNGTEESTVSIWYESKPERRTRVIEGWKQFAADVAAYQPEQAKLEVVAAPVENLPSVVVQVTGSLAVTDNLAKFGTALEIYLGKINREPKTDQDFADADSAIKTLIKAEEALNAAEASALAQVECIDTMRNLKAKFYELACSNRLALEKLVKAEKENRKAVIVGEARAKLDSYIRNLPNANIMPAINADFGAAIKGLKTITSVQNAADTTLATAKIEARKISDLINANLEIIGAQAEYASLFADRNQLALKPTEVVQMTVDTRIAAHKEAEAKKLEAERERIRLEEEARAQREAEQKAEVERARIRAEEQAKAAEDARMQREAIDRAAAVEREAAQARAAETKQNSPFLGGPNFTRPDKAPEVDTGARITLGQIKTAIAPLSIDQTGLLQLGIESVGKDRAAILYRESDLPRIFAAIIEHVTKASALKLAA